MWLLDYLQDEEKSKERLERKWGIELSECDMAEIIDKTLENDGKGWHKIVHHYLREINRKHDENQEKQQIKPKKEKVTFVIFLCICQINIVITVNTLGEGHNCRFKQIFCPP